MITLADGTMVDPISGDIMTRDQIIATIRRVAEENGVPGNVALAVAQQESGFNPMAVGDGGHSHGLFQENDMGRAYGRAPDYDIVRQTERFAAEYREVAAANPGANPATLAYLAQRPADRQGYISAIGGILGTSGGGGRMAAPMPDAWIPKGPIKRLVKVGTQYQVIYEDETIPPEMVNADQIETPENDEDRVSATSLANISASRASQASSQAFTGTQNALERAQQQGQFQSTQDMERAKFNITQQFNQAIQKWNEARDSRDYDAMQFWARRADEFNTQRVAAENANRDVTRGQTLLSLGSRPDTLGRYLYAVQGQQAPQGFGFGTEALPGFGPNAQNPTVPGLGQSATAGPIPGLLAGAGAPLASSVMNPTAGNPDAVARYQQAFASGENLAPFVAPGGTSITAGPVPGIQPVVLQPGMPASATQGPTAEQLRAQEATIASGRTPRFYSNGIAVFGEGGPVDEPVLGRGLLSGLPYMIGERGPETIVPEGKTLAQAKGKKGKRRGSIRTFATGGVIGANAQGVSGWWDPGDANTPPTFHPGPRPSAAVPAPSVMTPTTIGGSPTRAETAMTPQGPVWAGGPYAGQLVTNTPANAGDLTPYLMNPNLPDPTGRIRPAAPKPQRTPAGRLPAFSSLNEFSQWISPIRAGQGIGTGGQMGPGVRQSVFNPPGLSQYLSGQFLRPGIPNFPQYQQATGGTSLLSNARWLNQATPSERGLFEGFLRDEAGVPPEDALALAGRMAPRSGQLRTPGYRSTY